MPTAGQILEEILAIPNKDDQVDALFMHLHFATRTANNIAVLISVANMIMHAAETDPDEDGNVVAHCQAQLEDDEEGRVFFLTYRNTEQDPMSIRIHHPNGSIYDCTAPNWIEPDEGYQALTVLSANGIFDEATKNHPARIVS